MWTINVENQDYSRIDVFLQAHGDLSRNAYQRLIVDGRVFVDGKTARKNHKVSVGELIEVDLPELKAAEALPEQIALDIMYEDKDIIVINKPRGIVVHPSPGHDCGTLVNALLFHCGGSLSGIGGVMRPGIVHRLDKDTSGLMVCAKNDMSHVKLSDDLKARRVSRVYECVVRGAPKEDIFSVSAPLGRHPVNRKKQAVAERDGRDAVTHFEVLERYGKWAYLSCRLETGRTHQIRVHLTHKGFPVAGDMLYGPEKDEFKLGGQCLHARYLSFCHPRSGEKLCFATELPEYFERVIRKLRERNTD